MAEEIKKTLRGRPLAFILTQEMLDEIQKLSSCGLNQRQIRDYYGIAHTTWQTKRRRFPEILEYFNKGKSKGTAFVANKLMELVKKGHFNAIRFYLETVGEFGTAADDEENEEDLSRYQINDTLPEISKELIAVNFTVETYRPLDSALFVFLTGQSVSLSSTSKSETDYK